MRNQMIAIATVLSIGLGWAAQAQTFEIPKNDTMVTREDYARLEPDVIRCIDFLESMPLDRDKDEASEANSFLVRWATGSPSVNVEVHEYVSDLMNKNEEFLVIFLGGWIKYALQNRDSTDTLRLQMEALRAIIRVYKHSAGVVKDEAVDRLVEVEDKGKLREWLEHELASERTGSDH